VLAIAVRLDFFWADEIDLNADGVEVSAALPPEAVNGLGDAWVRTPEGSPDELMVGWIKVG
jgi:hypothetical protein